MSIVFTLLLPLLSLQNFSDVPSTFCQNHDLFFIYYYSTCTSFSYLRALCLFSLLLAKLFPGYPQYPFPFLPSIWCWGAISSKILSPSATANIKPRASLLCLVFCFSSEQSVRADPSCRRLSSVSKVTLMFQHPGQHPATGNQWEWLS